MHEGLKASLGVKNENIHFLGLPSTKCETNIPQYLKQKQMLFENTGNILTKFFKTFVEYQTVMTKIHREVRYIGGNPLDLIKRAFY